MPTDNPDTIDISRVLAQTSIGHVHYLPEADSTNNQALCRAVDLPDDQSELVLASRQTAGRGRGQNRWYSAEGSLTFSLITRLLPIAASQTPAVSLVAGLAACLASERHAPRAQPAIKWPNDVYLNERKAAGVLIEVARPATPRFVVGIGMNVNNTLAGAPQEVRDRAISLCDAAGQPVGATDLLIDFLNLLDEHLAMLITDGPRLARLWRGYCLLTGRRVRLSVGGRTLEGECQGIADDGALLLATPQGVTPCYGGVVEIYA